MNQRENRRSVAIAQESQQKYIQGQSAMLILFVFLFFSFFFVFFLCFWTWLSVSMWSVYRSCPCNKHLSQCVCGYLKWCVHGCMCAFLLTSRASLCLHLVYMLQLSGLIGFNRSLFHREGTCDLHLEQSLSAKRRRARTRAHAHTPAAQHPRATHNNAFVSRWQLFK